MFGLWSRKKPDAQQRAEEIRQADFAKFERILTKGGWLPFLHHRPPLYETVELLRYEWDGPVERRPVDLDPQLNIVGLYWRFRQKEPRRSGRG